MLHRQLCILPTLFVLLSFSGDSHQSHSHLNLTVIQDWATNIQVELKIIADFVTRKARVEESFSHASLEKRADAKVGEEITEAIKSMMKMKVEAVKRIMEVAENASEDAKDEEVKDTYQYYNAKCVNGPSDEPPCSNYTMAVDLTRNPHFWDVPVNTGFSVVHVPTNVFDRARDVLKPIKWSAELDHTFKSNYENDPSLTWQYFGSSTGIMRHYPALKWKYTHVDLYDCRNRAWYIEAASSPKDMVILVDQSGSMTGERKEIARHVVDDILDTLGNNDYVNILSFDADATELVPCFQNQLVQANLANIRTFKEKLPELNTTGVANFSLALEKAFDLLAMYRGDGFDREDPNAGANCNQAIMLVTDGVPYNYEDTFRYYNWPDMPVRVFTYLVGGEVADVREIRWMACANRGYYVHISTSAEVREQVLQYVPVMARPLVLSKTNHPVIWTPVYADVQDPKMTDWIWERKEDAVQKKVFHECKAMERKRNALRPLYFRPDPATVEHMKIMEKVDSKIRQDYKLMTSVSVPVFDKRDNANITERVLLNEAVWVEQTREVRTCV